MQEIWKDIGWYEWLYQVSNLWKFRSIFCKKHNKYRDKIYRWWITKWYISYSIRKDNKQKKLFYHRLIAIAFIPNPDNQPCVNHKNWIKTDNSIDNLEWCTYSENNKHAYWIWLKKVTENNNMRTNNPRSIWYIQKNKI